MGTAEAIAISTMKMCIRDSRERDPERHHVEVRERHVFRAGLDGQEEIAERGERGSGEHEEDHDGAVHGHQLQVVLRRHHVTRRARLGEQVQPGNGPTAESEVDAHEPGEKHSDQGRDQGQRVILLADHFVVDAEDRCV